MESENKNATISIIGLALLAGTLLLNLEWIYESCQQYAKTELRFFKNALIFYGVYLTIQMISAIFLVKELWSDKKNPRKAEISFIIALILATFGIFLTTYMVKNH